MADTVCGGSLDELRQTNVALGKYNSIYKEGFQAGMKHAAEIVSPIKNIIPTNQWCAGYQESRKETEQAILKEANSCPENVLSSSDSPDN